MLSTSAPFLILLCAAYAMAANLFTPIQVGSLHLANRIFMAPLTRCRAGTLHIPNALMKEHYAQRASAGLIIAEATMIAEKASAFIREPGAYNAEQLAGWKEITDAVHAKDGKIFLQIWHGGRAAHPDNNDGARNVAPSAIAIDGEVNTLLGKKRHVVPHALTVNEIATLVDQFEKVAKNAVDVAGFDGVEVHGANGYVIDQFLRTSSNVRTDQYGGSLENRGRFLTEILQAVTEAIGADRVGVRFSPLHSGNSMRDEDPLALSEHVAKIAQRFNLAYVHVLRYDRLHVVEGDIVPIFRKHFHNTLISNVEYTKDEANADIAAGLVDAVAFGVPFIGNPDLVERFRRNAPLNQADVATYYKGDATGYNDYPFLPAGSTSSDEL
ncbi:unnamed protein product [Aphanomyces euteiches]|uniref:NADH:flavin oxidoreductase/NADH oxidase N-terminal domain-containing protein n=1 Tax=Aphanomyces euteiches TaxID=100861 RepID=A0A6G0XEZ3_9STRA|nr:hypothetical protein Ae201684_005572 [Aphanomyces euteiches]KAH9078225.1 hypothetical protein Ae201684P_019316 [Aphanomyces euteiches]KAH9142407.1 hypothetical protein AeRB84_013515 [Aphanomyces euteiches]